MQVRLPNGVDFEGEFGVPDVYLGLTPVERRGEPDWTKGEVQLQSKPNNGIRQTHRNLEQKSPMSEVPCWGIKMTGPRWPTSVSHWMWATAGRV